MKTKIASLLFVIATLLAAGATSAKEVEPASEVKTVLPLVVVDTLNQHGAIDDVDRLDLAFQYVAKKRKWPVTVKLERFGAGSPDHETELRIFNRPVRQEIPGEFTFRAWVLLTIAGKKTDFGIVVFRHSIRIGENIEDTLEKVFRGAAQTIADKVEPLLFPKPVETK